MREIPMSEREAGREHEDAHLGLLGRAMRRAETRERSRAQGEARHGAGGEARVFRLPVPAEAVMRGSPRARVAFFALLAAGALVFGVAAASGEVIAGLWGALALVVVGLSVASLAASALPAAATGIVVGVDGVTVRGRFVSHARIRQVRHELRRKHPGFTYAEASEGPSDEWVLALDLTDSGEALELASRLVGSDLPDTWGAEVAGEIEGARAAWSAAQREREPDEGAMERGHRTGSEWLHDLRQLGTGTRGPYRRTAIDTEHLSRLLDDARAKPSSRAAAAIVLLASGDATSPSRLRVAASAVANPRLRIALENVAHADDDQVVAEALEELEREEKVLG